MPVGINTIYLASANVELVCPNDVNVQRQECCPPTPPAGRDWKASACDLCSGKTLYDPWIWVRGGWPTMPSSPAPCNDPPSGQEPDTNFVISPWNSNCYWGQNLSCTVDVMYLSYCEVRIYNTPSVYIYFYWELRQTCPDARGEWWSMRGNLNLTAEELVALCDGEPVDLNLEDYTGAPPSVSSTHYCSLLNYNRNTATTGLVRIQF